MCKMLVSKTPVKRLVLKTFLNKITNSRPVLIGNLIGNRSALLLFSLLLLFLVGCGRTPNQPPNFQAEVKSCGDGKVTGEEVCDTAIQVGAPGACPSEETCRAMQPSGCALSYTLAGEECSAACVPQRKITECSEQTDGCCPTGCEGIDPDCTSTDPVCGDGKKTGNEKCDIGIHYLFEGACPRPEFCEGYREGEDSRGSCQVYQITGEGCQQECTKIKDRDGSTPDDCINDDGCCPGGQCNDTNDSDCRKTLKLGDKCTYGKDYECPGPNPYCYTADINNLGLAHCVTKCTDDHLCGDPGTVCVSVPLRDYGVCTLSCTDDPTICKGNFFCDKLQSGRSACVYDPLTELENPGAPCIAGGTTCGKGTCFAEGTNNLQGGYCSAPCNRGDRCADGSECVVDVDLGFLQLKYCGVGCTEGPAGDAKCNTARAGYVCSQGRCQPPPCTVVPACATPPCADLIQDDKDSSKYYKKMCDNGGECYKTNFFGYVCKIP